METKNDASLEKKIDNKIYSDAELISIKTTLNLPYYTSSRDFERAYGSINIDGKDYEYVMRRVYQDTLELLCLPNYAKTKMQAINNDLMGSSVDGQATSPGKKSSAISKVNLPEFFQQKFFDANSLNTVIKQTYFSLYSLPTFEGYTSPQERPPQSMHIIS